MTVKGSGKVALNKARPLYRFDNGELGCGRWRLSSEKELTRPGCETYLSFPTLLAGRHTLRLYAFKAGYGDLNSFLGLVPDIQNQILIRPA